MEYQHLSCKTDKHIATITLMRPDKKNALSSALRSELINCLDKLESDGTKAIIITGAGDTFCAGFDLTEFKNGNMKEIFSHADIYHHRLHICPVPIIAAINGNAYAGGMDLAALCDLRISVGSANFAQPQVKMGIPAAYELLRTLVPESIARDICLTGKKINANQALSYGFLNSVVDQSDLMMEAIKLATTVAESLGSRKMKEVFIGAQPALFGVEYK